MKSKDIHREIAEKAYENAKKDCINIIRSWSRSCKDDLFAIIKESIKDLKFKP